jgi:hypothetical protein
VTFERFAGISYSAENLEHFLRPLGIHRFILTLQRIRFNGKLSFEL